MSRPSDSRGATRALPLDAIAGWEAAILAGIAGASGSLDERHAQIARSGLYGEYPAILAAYHALLAHPTSGAEALKRATFLAWWSAVAPPAQSAILDLPEALVRDVVHALERRLQRGAGDDELRWMLAWYHGCAPLPFDVYGSGGDAIAGFVAGHAMDGWRTRALAPAAFMNRGQMGRYWRELLDGRRLGAAG